MSGDATLSELSTSAASNTSVGGVSIAEGCAMSNLNNGERAILAAAVGALTFIATSDSSDVYTATMAPAPAAYVQDFPYNIKFGTANTTTAPTLNLNSLGAKTIVNRDGSTLAIGALNGNHTLTYDGTNFRVLNTVSAQNLATIGHVILPGGLIMNWGQLVFTGQTSLNVTFDQAYASAFYTGIAIPTTNSTCWVSAVSTTAMTIAFNGATTTTVLWWSVGK